jgi:hypothetical protein
MAYFLGTEHWLDALTPPLQRHIERLSKTVAHLVSETPVDQRELEPPTDAVSARLRQRVLLGAAVVLVVAATTALALIFGDAGVEDLPYSAPADQDQGSGELPESGTDPSPTVRLEEVARFTSLPLEPTGTAPPGKYHGFVVSDSVLALANGTDGVTRLGIGDPTQPRPMDTFGVSDARKVAFLGDYLVAVSGDPSSPTVVVFPTDGSGGVTIPMDSLGGRSVYHVAAGDRHLYLTGHNFFGIVDASDPRSPELVFDWEPPGHTGNPADIFLDGELGYVSAGWDGLYIFDLGDPTAPVVLGHWSSPNWILDVVVDDGIAYVTLGESGLAAVDVSDPRSPVMLGSVPLTHFASKLDVAHGHAFVTMWTGGSLGGIAVVDVRDPAHPVHVGDFGALQSVTGLRVVGDHLILSEEGQGLIFYEIVGVG